MPPVLFWLFTSQAVIAIGKTLLKGLGVGIFTVIGGVAFIAAIEAYVRVALGDVGATPLAILQLARVDDAIMLQLYFANVRLTIAGGKKLKLL